MLTHTSRGIKIAYLRRGAGTPLVLIHGYPLDHSIWNPILPRLEKDFEMIVPDLRGFGKSTISREEKVLTKRHNFSLIDLGEDIHDLLHSLGIKKAVLAGHSMGGYVALGYAQLHPEEVMGLGLIATQAAGDTAERKAGRYLSADQVDHNGVEEVAENMSKALTSDPTLQEKMRGLILRQNKSTVANSLRAMAERPDASGFLPGFPFPLLIVQGLKDKIIPLERAFEMKEKARKSYLVLIKEAGHLPMIEAPDETAEAIKILK